MNDLSQKIIPYLYDEEISSNLNPIIKYMLVSIYDEDFRKRSPMFSEALFKLFRTFNKFTEIPSFFNSEMIIKGNINETTLTITNTNTNALTSQLTLPSQSILYEKSEKNEDEINIDDINNFLNNNWEWSADKILEYNNDYILDISHDNVLVDLIKEYIFTKEDPKSSKLLICYNIIASSVELSFCIQLVLKFPKLIMHERERHIYENSQKQIKTRLEKLIIEWKRMFSEGKLKRNSLLRKYFSSNFSIENEDNSIGSIDLIEMTKEEPILKKNFISFSTLIQEGIFLFKVEEIAKQICLIDQNLLSEITIEDCVRHIKQEEGSLFSNIILRERQFKAYVLFFIYLITCIQVRKTVIEKFIELAYCLKKMNNNQTYVTIIKTFMFINLKDKVSLWDQLDNEHKSLYLNMTNEVNSFEMNEGIFNTSLIKKIITSTSSKNEASVNVYIPNSYSLASYIEIIKRKANKDKYEEKYEACTEFKEFFLILKEIRKNKLPYYENNPLYDFLFFGFKEIFRTDIWRPQFKKYAVLRPLIEDGCKIDKILEHLDEKFKKIDSK